MNNINNAALVFGSFSREECFGFIEPKDCLLFGETVPQPEWNVPTDDGFVPNKVGAKGINLFRFELSNARCRAKPKKLGDRGLGGLLLAWLLQKNIPIFSGENLFSAREKSVKITYAPLVLLAYLLQVREASLPSPSLRTFGAFLIKLNTKVRYHEQQHQADSS